MDDYRIFRGETISEAAEKAASEGFSVRKKFECLARVNPLTYDYETPTPAVLAKRSTN